jgi:hypothetical protein
MNRTLRPYAMIAVAAIIVGIIENALFGSDKAGTKHDISVAFFFLTVLSALALITIVALSLVGRARSSASL